MAELQTTKLTRDYYMAPSGEGELAATWKDKPHRLVYDLVKLTEELAAALLDVLDGNHAHDIQYMTGLPESRCHEIAELHNRIRAKVG